LPPQEGNKIAGALNSETQAFLKLPSGNRLPDVLGSDRAVGRFRALAAASLSFWGEPESLYRVDDEVIDGTSGPLTFVGANTTPSLHLWRPTPIDGTCAPQKFTFAIDEALTEASVDIRIFLAAHLAVDGNPANPAETFIEKNRAYF
jgi:hypothetical protein